MAKLPTLPLIARPVSQLPTFSNIESPAENPTAWNTVVFDLQRPPGKWRVTGVRERLVDNPKKKGDNKNTLIDQGIAPGEVDFEVETYTGQQLRDLQEYYVMHLSPDRRLAQASVVMVAHPALSARDVKQIYGFRASFPEPRGDKGDVPVVSKFTAKVFNKNTKIGGGSTKPKPRNAGGNIAVTRLDKLVEALQVTSLLAFPVASYFLDSPDVQGVLRSAGVNVDDVALQAPIATSPVILPYKEASAVSILTGSIPDTMITDIAAARAPR